MKYFDSLENFWYNNNMKKEKKQSRIEHYAEQVVKCEKAMERGENVTENQQQVEQILAKLSEQEIEQLDDYIMRKNLMN